MPSPIGQMLPGRISIAARCLRLEENRFALAAVEQLADKPDTLHPRMVFVSGPAGCGKTLLAELFFRAEVTEQPDVAILHVTAAEFAAEFAEASEAAVIPHFQERYRTLQVLVVEDLRALSNRTETLQQLELAIDHILNNGGRVLLTSRCPPGELVDFPSRLVNRFHAGVCASIDLPDYNSRVQLLQHFAQELQIAIPYESICLLAGELAVSPRELSATLKQLAHTVKQQRCTLEPETVHKYLASEIKPAETSLVEITRAVARHFSTSMANLRGHSRRQSFILPRQCAMSLARSMTGLPLVRIAEYFGNRHHSSVAHACERLEQLKTESADVRQHLTQITNKLGDLH